MNDNLKNKLSHNLPVIVFGAAVIVALLVGVAFILFTPLVEIGAIMIIATILIFLVGLALSMIL